MLGVAFDLDYAAVQAFHPKGMRQAYKDIEKTLISFGFRRVQQSLYVDSTDLVHLMRAITALRALSWLPQTLADMRAFRLENWPDLTPFIKDGPR